MRMMAAMRRSTLIVLLGAALTAPAAAQEAADGNWRPPHLGAPAPDYLAALRYEGVPAIRMPLPPERGPRLDPHHHAGAAPDYLVAVALSDETIPHPTQFRMPPPPPGRPPAVVRGVYLNAWVFGSGRFYDLVALADTTEINAFVIDVKDATGFIAYRSSVPTAVAIGANRLIRARDARRRLATLEAHGIHAIARIVVARDPLLAKRKPEWAIHHVNGGLWRDGLGEPWVDAYHDSVWVYAADIAAEAVVMGFKEIQFDYVRFPDEPPHRLNNAMYAARNGNESKRAAMRRHVGLLRDRVSRLGVPFTLDVFGLTTSARNGMGIGQYWEDLSHLADVLLPMVYPSHYPRGSYGIAHPNSEPYVIVRRALEDGITRSAAVASAARIRPYLQAFTLRRPRYTATHVREQIRAVEDVGLTDWVLWNASGRYPAGALRPLRYPPALLAPAVGQSEFR
jgi:hypothetical protein